MSSIPFTQTKVFSEALKTPVWKHFSYHLSVPPLVAP